LGQDSLLFLDVLTEGVKVFLDLALEAPPLGFPPRIRGFSGGFAPAWLCGYLTDGSTLADPRLFKTMAHEGRRSIDLSQGIVAHGQ
jgi:hypothetical protein